MGLERLNEYKKRKGLTNAQLSEMTGLTISTIDKITSGYNTNPKLSTVEALCKVLDCTINDLLVNEKTTLTTTKSDITPKELLHIKKYRTLDDYGKEAVDSILNIEYNRCTAIAEDDNEPEIEIKHSYYKVSAGTGFDLGNGDDWETIYIPDTPEGQKADFALTIQGDSMEPIYFDGDIVLVKEQPSIDIGEIGIFTINGDGYIKKYGGDRLISLNAKYDDIEFSDEDNIKCCGKVIGRV